MKKNGVKSLSPGIQQSDTRNIDELLAEALVEEGEQPYKAPNNWIWVKLDNLCKKIVDGTHETPQYTETGVPFISVKDIRHRKINFEDCKYISEADHNFLKKRCNPEKNDVLLTKSGSIGRTAVVNFNLEFSLFVSVALLKPFSTILNSAFLAYGLESYINSIDVNQSIKGAVIKNFHISDLKKLEFPLSPLKEQLHIVEKLDSMLGKIAAARELIREARESFEARSDSILHKAFTGEFTKKWRAENKNISSVDTLLNRIIGEKRNQFKKLAIDDIDIKNEDIFCEIPASWRWSRFRDICRAIKDGTHFSPKTQYLEEGKNRFLYLTSKNIRDNGISLDEVIYIDEKTHRELFQRCDPEEGDILLVKDGAKTGTVTVNTLKEEFSLLSSVALIKVFPNTIEPLYIKNFLISPIGKKIISEDISGSAITRITLAKISKFMIPIPPLEEQQEIVRILNSLMRSEEEAKELIDLENCLDSLEKSILFKAFRGKLGTNNPGDEPAIELLKHILAEKEEIKRLEPKRVKERGGNSMDVNERVKKPETNPGLVEILKEANERMKPETLFEKAGYTHETIEEFYGELKRFVENNEIYEERPNDSDVFLGINDHENRKTLDKRI